MFVCLLVGWLVFTSLESVTSRSGVFTLDFFSFFLILVVLWMYDTRHVFARMGPNTMENAMLATHTLACAGEETEVQPWNKAKTENGLSRGKSRSHIGPWKHCTMPCS